MRDGCGGVAVEEEPGSGCQGEVTGARTGRKLAGGDDDRAGDATLWAGGARGVVEMVREIL